MEISPVFCHVSDLQYFFFLLALNKNKIGSTERFPRPFFNFLNQAQGGCQHSLDWRTVGAAVGFAGEWGKGERSQGRGQWEGHSWAEVIWAALVLQLAGEPATLQEGLEGADGKDTDLSVSTWTCPLKSFVRTTILGHREYPDRGGGVCIWESCGMEWEVHPRGKPQVCLTGALIFWPMTGKPPAIGSSRLDYTELYVLRWHQQHLWGWGGVLHILNFCH